MTCAQWVVWFSLVGAAIVFFCLRKATPAKPPNPPSPIPAEPERRKHWIDLLKLEYEKAADRYEYIYRAVWQNFSYMAVVAGGILTFMGKDLGSRAALYFLALTPLFFWLVATYLPLDHYGDEIRRRLRAIEDDINRVYFSDEGDPKLQHFKLFEGTHYKWRVRHAVAGFGIAITLAWLYFGVLFGSEIIAHRGLPGAGAQTLELETKPMRIEVRDPGLPPLRDSVSQLAGRIKAVESLVRLRVDTARAPSGQSDTTHR